MAGGVVGVGAVPPVVYFAYLTRDANSVVARGVVLR